jgi:hypothetical protein
MAYFLGILSDQVLPTGEQRDLTLHPGEPGHNVTGKEVLGLIVRQAGNRGTASFIQFDYRLCQYSSDEQNH